MNRFSLVAASVLLSLSGLAHAGGVSPFYAGVAIGSGSSNIETPQIESPNPCNTPNETCSSDDSDQTWQVYGGTQLSNNIAVEVGYVNLGDTAILHYSDPIDATQSTEGFSVAGIVSTPVGKNSPVSVYGKAGLYRWTSEVEIASDNPTKNGLKAKKSGIDPVIGAGVQYDITPFTAIRAGWDRYLNVGERDYMIDATGTPNLETLDTDVDVFSAGIHYSFL